MLPAPLICLMFDYVSIVNFLILQNANTRLLITSTSYEKTLTKFYDTYVCLSYAVVLNTYIPFACHAHSFVQWVAVRGLHANQQTSSLQWRLLNRIHNRQPTIFISIDLFTLDYKRPQQRNWHEVCFPPWIAVRPSRQYRHARLLPAYAHIPHPEGGPLQ